MEATVENRIVLNVEDYQKFVDLLKFISQGSTDVIIKDGIIRQASDSKTVIYQINTGIPGLNLNIPVVKNQLDILKAFIPDEDADETEIIFEIDDKTFRLISDGSVVEWYMPKEEVLSTQFIDEDKFASIFKDVICEIPLKQSDINKIQVLAKNFATEIAEFKVNDNGKTSIVMTSASKQKRATIRSFNIPNEDMFGKTYTTSTNVFYEGDDAKYDLIETTKDFKAIRLTADGGRVQVYGVLREVQ